jgi:hypothetical protein
MVTGVAVPQAALARIPLGIKQGGEPVSVGDLVKV